MKRDAIDGRRAATLAARLTATVAGYDTPNGGGSVAGLPHMTADRACRGEAGKGATRRREQWHSADQSGGGGGGAGKAVEADLHQYSNPSGLPARPDAELFGQYRLEALLASGGMGEVYRAFDTARQRRVALKRLPTAFAEDSYFRARFRMESALAAQLNEPHVIPIHDFGEIDGRLFIDMRLVGGANLAVQLAENGPLAPGRAVNIIAQVAAALDAAHRAGLVHRDIKPENVLIVTRAASTLPDVGNRASGHRIFEDAADFVYVGDFGIAQAAAIRAQIALTPTGAIIGTVYYIAPERLLRGYGDHRVDVYALGCVLYELLTGKKPFPSHGMEQCYAHINTPPPRPSDHHNVPVAFDAVIARAMAKNPDHRFASAGALASRREGSQAGIAGVLGQQSPRSLSFSLPSGSMRQQPRVSHLTAPGGRPCGRWESSSETFIRFCPEPRCGCGGCLPSRLGRRATAKRCHDSPSRSARPARPSYQHETGSGMGDGLRIRRIELASDGDSPHRGRAGTGDRTCSTIPSYLRKGAGVPFRRTMMVRPRPLSTHSSPVD
jgi:serine/threonine protein kinase